MDVLREGWKIGNTVLACGGEVLVRVKQGNFYVRRINGQWQNKKWLRKGSLRYRVPENRRRNKEID